MIYKIVLIFISMISIQISLYASDYSSDESSWQKDGRSMGLGGGMNALEQEMLEGISINYLLPYNLAELSTRSLKISHRTKWLNLEGLWSQTGDVVFRENYFSIGVSRNLTESFLLKVKTGYYHSDFITGEKGSTFLAEINCKYKLNEKLEADIYLFNPTGSKIMLGGTRIPLNQAFHLGCTYFPAKNIQGIIELEKSQPGAIIGHFGLEYTMFELFVLRAGLSTQPFMPSWGIGGKYHRLYYALGANIHPLLGYSSCFSVGYNW